MDIGSLKWGRELASNKYFGSTQLAEIDGKQYVVRRIDHFKNAPERTAALRKTLDLQIVLAGSRDIEGIVLFRERTEYQGELLYLRDFVEGETLADLLKKEPYMEPRRAAELIVKIARVVGSAHENPQGVVMIHGDLKPENIVIRGDSVSIIDWDTMRIRNAVNKELLGGPTIDLEALVGTPYYMAPEQFENDGKITPQIDVYALGVIFYRMLTGKTPFDDLSLMEIMNQKKTVSNNLQGPGVTPEFAELICKTLHPDRNQRTASVADFIQDVQSARMVMEDDITPPPDPGSTTGGVPVFPGPLPPDGCNLVLVGGSGSGKTVLAAGLSASSAGDFQVQPMGDETQNFCLNACALMKTGGFPAHNNNNPVVTTLRFRLSSCGKNADISFREYAGEALKSVNYFTDFLQQPDGVLLLLNPSLVEINKPRIRDEQIQLLKNCIEYLNSLPSPPPVALVVTAADRLETDLKERVGEFQELETQVFDFLKSRKRLQSASFRVSVTGQLATQSQAALNPDGVREPFIWLLEQQEKRRRYGLLRKCCRIAAMAGAALLLALAGRGFYEWHLNREFDQSVAQVEQDFEGKTKIDKLAESAANYRPVDRKSGSRTGNLAGVKKRFFLFPFLRRSFDRSLDKLEERIDQENHGYFTKRLDKTCSDETILSPNFDSKLKDDFSQWSPLTQGAQKQALQTRMDKELPPAKERHDFYMIEQQLDDIIKNKWGTKKSLEKVGERMGELPPSEQTKLTAEERTKNDRKVAQRKKEALMTVKDMLLAKLREAETQCTELPEQFAKFHRQWRSCYRDWDPESADISVRELKAAETNYVTALCVRYEKDQLDTPKKIDPKFQNQIKNSLIPEAKQLDLEFGKGLENLVKNSISLTETKWDNKRKAVIHSFIENNRSVNASAKNVLKNLDELCNPRNGDIGEKENPYLGDAVRFALDTVRQEASAFLNRVKNRDIESRSFREMSNLCNAVVRYKKFYPEAPIVNWAKEYDQWFEKNRDVEVKFDKPEARVSDYSPLKQPYFNLIVYKHNKKEIARYEADGWSCDCFDYEFKPMRHEFKEIPLPNKIIMKLNDKLDLYWSVFDCQGVFKKDKLINSISKTIYPGLEEVQSEYSSSGAWSSNGIGNIHIRPNITIKGTPFDAWISAHPLPEVNAK